MRQRSTALLQRLSQRFSMVVWWASSVEAHSAFARELRARIITASEHRNAILRLADLQGSWREIQPTEDLRALAESMLNRYEIRAAGALQLAAAYTWALNRPFNRPFISGDKKLLLAAQQAGFHVVDTA
jgi:predicted nucleic acid-binding protein